MCLFFSGYIRFYRFLWDILKTHRFSSTIFPLFIHIYPFWSYLPKICQYPGILGFWGPGVPGFWVSGVPGSRDLDPLFLGIHWESACYFPTRGQKGVQKWCFDPLFRPPIWSKSPRRAHSMCSERVQKGVSHTPPLFRYTPIRRGYSPLQRYNPLFDHFLTKNDRFLEKNGKISITLT